MDKIIIFGSLAYDYIMNFNGYFKDHIQPDKIHILNVCFNTNKLVKGFGGTAGNIAYNLSMLNVTPIIYSTAGRDFSDYQKWLKKNRIAGNFIKINRYSYTSSAYIITDKNDNQITAFYPGSCPKNAANISLPKKISADIKMGIVSPWLDKKLIIRAVQWLANNRIPAIFDPGQWATYFTKQELLKILKQVQLLIGNDYEITTILKKINTPLNKLAITKELKIITTCGPEGSVLAENGKQYRIKKIKIKNDIDPTGAGDAYRAGLLKGLLSRLTLEKAGRLAAIVALYTVEKYGTQTHHFAIKDVQKRYYSIYREYLRFPGSN